MIQLTRASVFGWVGVQMVEETAAGDGEIKMDGSDGLLMV